MNSELPRRPRRTATSDPQLEVDTDELRRAASAVDATGDRVTAGTAGEPRPDQVPRWVTTDAAAQAAEAARQQLAVLGADIADTARLITEAAREYELADARAATRLRLTR